MPQFQDGKLMLTGTVVAQPPAFGIAAFNDWAKIPADYDAVSWTCKVDDKGRFRLEIGEMRPGLSQLRLKVCHTSGATSNFAFDYEVDSRGRPNMDVFRYRLPLEEAVAAYAAGDRAKVQALAAELQRRFPDVPEVHRKASHLLRLLEAGPPRPLSELPAKDGWVSISGARFRSASTGWGPPLRDQVPVEKPGQCFLQVGGKFFEQGLYAHAPSKYELELDGKWARFRSAYGLQDGHPGSVVFVVRGDGRELFRSSLVKDQALRKLDVDVRGVSLLELSVEDGGDGNNSDWGVWIWPQLLAVRSGHTSKKCDSDYEPCMLETAKPLSITSMPAPQCGPGRCRAVSLPNGRHLSAVLALGRRGAAGRFWTATARTCQPRAAGASFQPPQRVEWLF